MLYISDRIELKWEMEISSKISKIPEKNTRRFCCISNEQIIQIWNCNKNNDVNNFSKKLKILQWCIVTVHLFCWIFEVSKYNDFYNYYLYYIIPYFIVLLNLFQVYNDLNSSQDRMLYNYYYKCNFIAIVL